MHMTAIWTAFILAQSSGLLVEGIRSRHVDLLSTAQIAEVDGNPADNREPTCKELRVMWRYTKRQSRAIRVMNELPFIPDPYVYKAWKNYPAQPQPPRDYLDHYSERPQTRAAGSAPVYGRVVHKAPPGSRLRSEMPNQERSYEDVPHLYGKINFHPPSPRRRVTSFRIGGGASPQISQVPQAGSFQHLRDLIRSERARELREQHAADNKSLISAKTTTIKEYSNVDQDRYQNIQPRKHFANSLDEYQQFGNDKAEISRAWSAWRSLLTGIYAALMKHVSRSPGNAE
ncbi:hypothetical protein KPH14_002006 [Odynerus spinipes]|uniref:Uncharacterized protein n=1 Tax=Odynerus spinipes TaxID=1348599 RepID=A0AAD9S123_9HYME|nr:hypothetical protein KPH14_002006 [Odynerus spinipes]